MRGSLLPWDPSRRARMRYLAERQCVRVVERERVEDVARRAARRVAQVRIGGCVEREVRGRARCERLGRDVVHVGVLQLERQPPQSLPLSDRELALRGGAAVVSYAA